MTTPSLGAMRYQMEMYVPVLFSFAIQMFLFFAGRFHLQITDKFVRVLIWSAYLGADIVAVYALGSLSRQEGNPQSIAFFWAPFLLIHLGGQDTITAFTMKENNAWLTHLGKLVYYVGMAVTVFAKSIRSHKDLLLPGIFVFVTGLIKYGTRTWCLKWGSFESIENSTIRSKYNVRLPEASKKISTYSDVVLTALHSMLAVHDIFAARSEYKETVESESQDEEATESNEYKISIDDDELVESKQDNISTEEDEAVQSKRNKITTEGDEEVQMKGDEISIEDRQAAESQEDKVSIEGDEVVQLKGDKISTGDGQATESEENKISLELEILTNYGLNCKVVQLQLGMMNDDLYTKALLLRTRIGFGIRFTAMISASIVAFVLFLIFTDKQRYSKADIAVTMSLFIGELLLEVCTVLIFMMSPWTWAWLKVRKYNWLACFSWHLLSSRIGWPEERPRWSNSMGQYSCVNRLVGKDPPTSCTPKLMTLLRNMADKVGAKEEISWMSKLIHTKYVEIGEETMKRVATGLLNLINEFDVADEKPREWRYFGSFLAEIQDVLTADFGTALLMMHMVTEVYLAQYPNTKHSQEGVGSQNPEPNTSLVVDVCRKLSNYMVYLLVNHPSMLPLNNSAVSSLKTGEGMFQKEIKGKPEDEHFKIIQDMLLVGEQPEGDDVPNELADMWARVLLYAAGKSRAELHGAQLASGGELITIAWLLMAQNDLGDSRMKRINITNFSPHDESDDRYIALKEVHAFHIVHRNEVSIQCD